MYTYIHVQMGIPPEIPALVSQIIIALTTGKSQIKIPLLLQRKETASLDCSLSLSSLTTDKPFYFVSK